MTDKKTVTDFIERLTDKTLSFGCLCKIKKKDGVWIYHYGTISNACVLSQEELSYTGSNQQIEKIIGHPILIGDVLEAIINIRIAFPRPVTETADEWCEETVALWEECGFTKSLQTIIEENGWEWDGKNSVKCDLSKLEECVEHNKKAFQLTNPNARALIEFLLEIFK